MKLFESSSGRGSAFQGMKTGRALKRRGQSWFLDLLADGAAGVLLRACFLDEAPGGR